MKQKESVCLVEDFMSGIRVSKYMPVLVLFGCTCSLNTLQRLSKRFTSIKVWLDADKLDNARKIAQNAAMLGLKTQVIYTTKDPKNNTNPEIKEILNG